MIAALYVDPKGVYSGIEGVDCWGGDRDARLYPGPHPVVAHPPCTRWCQLARLVEARYGYRVGDDGGCFAAALASVRKWGGVLEHPAYTKAWAAYDLPAPDPKNGWQMAPCGGWVCHVEQAKYGHPARKATWLYAHGADLPQMRWGKVPIEDITATVSWCKRGSTDAAWANRRAISKKAVSATPPAFRDVLIEMARSCRSDT